MSCQKNCVGSYVFDSRRRLGPQFLEVLHHLGLRSTIQFCWIINSSRVYHSSEMNAPFLKPPAPKNKNKNFMGRFLSPSWTSVKLSRISQVSDNKARMPVVPSTQKKKKNHYYILFCYFSYEFYNNFPISFFFWKNQIDAEIGS